MCAISYSLKWPDDFDDYSWLLESKGWFNGLEILMGERTIKPMFYDPVRLLQDVESCLSSGDVFMEPMLIVMDRVTKENMERIIEKLAKTGELGRF